MMKEASLTLSPVGPGSPVSPVGPPRPCGKHSDMHNTDEHACHYYCLK